MLYLKGHDWLVPGNLDVRPLLRRWGRVLI